MALNDIKVPKENAQGTFDEVVLSRNDIGAAPATGISPTAITGTAVVDNDARLSDSRTPSSHSSSHATGGTDAIAPSSIGAQTLFTTTTLNLNSDTTLTAARATNYSVINSGNHTITLPTTGHLVGDIVVVRYTGGTGTLNVTWGAGGQTVVLGAQYRFIATGTGATNWALVKVDTHTHTFGTTAGTFTEGNDARLSDSRTPTAHAASHASAGSDPIFDQDLNTTDGPTFQNIQLAGGDVTWSGNVISGFGNSIDFENGVLDAFGMNAQADAFKIQDESDPTKQAVFSAGGITTGTIRTFTFPDASGTLALTSDIPALGTGAGEAAEGNHVHGNLTSDGKIGSTAGLPVVTTTAGAVTTLALGTAGQVLRTKSDLSGVEFADPASSGVTGAASSASDVLGVSGSDITGVDAAADRIVFWDDSASALKYLEAGSGLSISGTTMTVTATGGATNLWIPASAFIPKTTAGCGVDSRETSTNDQNFDELLFDAGTDEFADALVVMPSNYNNSTITARFYWTAASGSGDVIWGIQGRAFANDDALDTAAGTAQTVTDTLIAANDMHVSSATSAVTIGGTPAASTPIQFTLYRDANAAGDTLAVDARFLGAEIIFN